MAFYSHFYFLLATTRPVVSSNVPRSRVFLWSFGLWVLVLKTVRPCWPLLKLVVVVLYKVQRVNEYALLPSRREMTGKLHDEESIRLEEGAERRAHWVECIWVPNSVSQCRPENICARRCYTSLRGERRRQVSKKHFSFSLFTTQNVLMLDQHQYSLWGQKKYHVGKKLEIIFS